MPDVLRLQEALAEEHRQQVASLTKELAYYKDEMEASLIRQKDVACVPSFGVEHRAQAGTGMRESNARLEHELQAAHTELTAQTNISLVPLTHFAARITAGQAMQENHKKTLETVYSKVSSFCAGHDQLGLQMMQLQSNVQACAASAAAVSSATVVPGENLPSGCQGVSAWSLHL